MRHYMILTLLAGSAVGLYIAYRLTYWICIYRFAGVCSLDGVSHAFCPYGRVYGIPRSE